MDSKDPLAISHHPRFLFRCITPEDVPAVTEFARRHFFEFLVPLGWVRIPGEEEDWVAFFRGVIDKGVGLSVIALDRATGETVGMRLITEVTRQDPPLTPPSYFKSAKNQEIFTWFGRVVESVDVFKMYPEVQTFGDMLGIAVHQDYRHQGLAAELYKRSLALMKSKGLKIGRVGFSSPYSRKAATDQGYKMFVSEKCSEVRNAEGELISPNANENDIFDYGVFELFD